MTCCAANSGVSPATDYGSCRWRDRLRCQCEYHLPFKDLSPTTKVNHQRRLYCPTCLSGSATVVSLDICFGRKQPSATSFMSLIILVWCGGPAYPPLQCHQAYIVPFSLERVDGGQIRWAWYTVYQAFKSHSWSNSVYMVFPRHIFPLILYFHGV